MNIFEMLEEIQHKALRDDSLKEKILATESTKEPLG